MADKLVEQELFNTISTKMLAQGRQAVRAWGTDRYSCTYRADDGSRCGVGFVLDGEFLDQGESLDGGAKLPPHLEPHREFLTAMQKVHDGLPSGMWVAGLVIVGAARGLDTADLGHSQEYMLHSSVTLMAANKEAAREIAENVAAGIKVEV